MALLLFCAWVGGLEGETVQSGLPVDVRDRGRPSAPFARESSPSAPAKKEVTFVYQKLLLFLSKPQAWYIIRRKSVDHQGRVAPLYLITRQRASFLRLDDIQTFGLMIYRNKLRMIYKAMP